MKTIIITLAAFAVIACSDKKQDKRELFVVSLVEYLKNKDLDTLILDQPFFNSRFKEKKNPFNAYYLGLEEMKKMIDSKSYKILTMDDSSIDETIFILSVSSPSGSNKIYFLVNDEGIESFNPLFKGERIVSWM